MSWDWEAAASALPPLLRGLETTVIATIGGSVLALVLGGAWLLPARSRWAAVRAAAGFAQEGIRTTPLLIQLYVWYYVLPSAGLSLPAVVAGVIGLGLHYSTYVAEVYRAGIESVPRGQWDAARALSLTPVAAFRAVILPQALPPVVPALGNYVIAMFKDVPQLAAITVLEMLGTARRIGAETFHYLEPMTIVGLLFLVLGVAAAAGVRAIERRLAKAWAR